MRILAIAPLLWAVATLTFLVVEALPGDPVDLFVDERTTPELRAALRAKYCSDCPLHERYAALMSRLAVLDLGRSTGPGHQDQSVTDRIAEALPHTLALSGLTLAWVFPAGVAIGALQALWRGSVDRAVGAGSVALDATPEFVIALALVTLAPSLGLDASGAVDPLRHDDLGPVAAAADHLRHLALPALAMGLALLGGLARHARAAVQEAAESRFARTARAQGVPERRVVMRHVLRAAALPILVRFGLSIPLLASGSVVVERVFALPGMGRLLVQACFEQDLPVMIGCLFVFCVFVAGGNLFADALAGWADPRSRLA